MRRWAWLLARVGLLLAVLGSVPVLPATPSAAQTGCSGVGHRLRNSGADAWFTGARTGTVDTLQLVNPRTGDVTTIRSGASARPGYLLRGWLHVCVAGEDGSWMDYSGIVDFLDHAPEGNPFWNQHARHGINANGDQIIGEFFQVIPNNPPGPRNALLLRPALNYRNASVPGKGNCRPAPANRCYQGRWFGVRYRSGSMIRPTHRDGRGNSPCSTRYSSGYAALIEGVYDNSRWDLRIPNGGAVAAGHSMHVRLLYCANGVAIRRPAIALKFIGPPGDETVPWESVPTVPLPVTADRLHRFLDGGSVYQQAPAEPGPEVYAFIPRLLSKPGTLPDDNILAQGPVFTFTVCPRFNGVTCL